MDQSVWKLEDLIDLEWQFQQDADRTDEDLHCRDRRIYQQHIAPRFRDDTGPEPARLIRLWLDAIRHEGEGQDAWPGWWYAAGYRVVAAVSLVVALITGSAAANLLCLYDGTRPINVYVFLWIAVFSQVLLMFALIVGVFGLRKAGGWQGCGMVHRSWRWLIETVARRLSPRVSGEMRDRAQAGANIWRTSMAVYGGLWFWPVVAIRQMFGTVFNAALLMTFIGLISFRDLAFAWESTGVLDADEMHRLVSIVAIPWAWLFSHAHPTLEQVAQTQYEVRAGMAVMPTEALRSWWPFLVYALLVYGLLPRVVMWWLACVMPRRAVRRIRFDHGSCKRLLDRLRLPMVSTQGSTPGSGIAYPAGGTAIAQSASVATAPALASQQRSIPAGACAVVKWAQVPLPDDRIREQLESRWSLDVLAAVSAGGPDIELDRRAVTSVGRMEFPGQPMVVVVVEAWEEPTTDFSMFVRELRAAIGSTADIVVALVGRTEGGSPDRVTDSDLGVWKRVLQNLADPYLRVERLGGAA